MHIDQYRFGHIDIEGHGYESTSPLRDKDACQQDRDVSQGMGSGVAHGAHGGHRNGADYGKCFRVGGEFSGCDLEGAIGNRSSAHHTGAIE
jgi:hypothetical protein